MRLLTIFLRNVDEAVVCEFWKRSMRLYSDAKVHFERNYARLGAFQPSRRVRPRATDFEFYFIFFVCLFDTLRFASSYQGGSILLEEAVQKTKSVFLILREKLKLKIIYFVVVCLL